jgi:cell division protease FtsH
MFIGVGASRVRDLFKNAKSKAPCLVFIDEIDAIGRQRGSGVGGSNDEREQTLNQLLTEMDGFSGNTGVIVIAATNRADVLDSALLRPGRFDRQITVNLPDSKGRLSILKVHARNKNFSLDVSLPTLAQRTIGFSGADLANILNESAILATRRKKQLISMAELDSALDRVIQGLQGTNLRDTRSKRLLAYHEVGHALTATLLPDHDPVDKVTIIPRGQTVGMTWFTPLEDYELISQEQILARLVVSLGGRAAEEIVFGTQEMTTTSGNDINRVTRTVRQMVTLYGMSNIAPMAFSVKRKPVFLTGRPMMVKIVHPNTAAKIDSAVQKIISYSYKQARILINENRNALNHLTNILVEREIVSGVEFREILEQYTQLPAKKAYLSYFSEKEEENKKLETDYI